MNTDLSKLTDWFRANKLSLNVTKTVHMMFKDAYNKTPVPEDLNVKIGSELVQKVTKVKFLGLHIDNELKWTYHLKHCQSKLSSSLYALRSAKHVLSPKHLQILYNSLINPDIDYGILLWGSAMKSLLKPIETLQRKAIRIVCNAPYNAHTNILFRQTKNLTLEDNYHLQLSKFTFEYYNNSLPLGLSNIFVRNHDIHTHGTRHHNDPFISSRKSAFACKSILHVGPKLWHDIPMHLKNIESAKNFTKSLKRDYIKQYNFS